MHAARSRVIVETMDSLTYMKNTPSVSLPRHKNISELLTRQGKTIAFSPETARKAREQTKKKLNQHSVEDAPEDMPGQTGARAVKEVRDEPKTKQTTDSDTADSESGETHNQFVREYEMLITSLEGSILDDSPQEYEQLKGVIERIGALGKTHEQLDKLIHKQDALRQRMLLNEFKQGLDREQMPFGSHEPLRAAGVSELRLAGECYDKCAQFAQILSDFGALLKGGVSEKRSSEYKRLRTEAETLLRELTEEEVPAVRCVRNQLQKLAWIQLIRDAGHMSTKLDIEKFFINIEGILLKHAHAIEQHKAWLAGGAEGEEPDIGPLMKDVHGIMGQLDLRIDELHKYANSEQRVMLERFIDQIKNYYYDQIHYGLSGGRSFNPIKPSLGVVQQELSMSNDFATALAAATKLEDGLERINVLHWIADELTKQIFSEKKYSRPANLTKSQMTPGHMLTVFSEQNPSLQKAIAQFKQARELRNDIAHNGLISAPKRMQQACNVYEKTIETLADHFNLSLSKMHIEQHSRALKEQEYAGLLIDSVTQFNQRNRLTELSENEFEILLNDKLGTQKPVAKPKRKPTQQSAFEAVKRKANAEDLLLRAGKEIIAEHNIFVQRFQRMVKQAGDSKAMDIDLSEFRRMLGEDYVTEYSKFARVDDNELDGRIRKVITSYFAKRYFDSDYASVKSAYIKSNNGNAKGLFPAILMCFRNESRLTAQEKSYKSGIIEQIKKQLTSK